MLCLAVAASAVLGACTTAAPRPPAETAVQAAADQQLSHDVYAALNADPTYFYRHVDVHVRDGVADLSGYVWSTDAIYRARQITRAVPGVTSVVTSRLELERAGRSNGQSR